MFKSLPQFQQIYRTSMDNIGTSVFIPVLQESISYDRGVGYFSLEALSLLAEGIIPLLKNNGTIRVLTSVQLKEEDVEVILKGESLTQSVSVDRLSAIIDENLFLPSEKVKLNLDLITNLIAAKRIQIKVAYIEKGIYHEKIAIMKDREGEMFFALGSNNETLYGLRNNIESLSVMCSWKSEDARNTILEQLEYFNALWENQNKDIKVFDFPEALEQKLIESYKVSPNVQVAIENIEKSVSESTLSPSAPLEPEIIKKKLYPYQEKAIREFFERKGSHFYEMATGTGKTFTAIKTVQRVFEKLNGNLYVMVVVPQIDLQVQWQRAFQDEGCESYLFGGEGGNVEDDLAKSKLDYLTSAKPKLTVTIAIYETFFKRILPALIDSNVTNLFLIVDEAHELSPAQQSYLFDQSFPLKLGLSATPERQNPIESQKILNYFTNEGESFKYTINDAIKNGFLSHYFYHPIFVELTEDEFDDFEHKTIILSQLRIQIESEKIESKRRELEERRKKVAMERSIIIKKAKNKLLKLKEMIKDKRYNFSNSVVYCGMGKAVEGFEGFDDCESLINQVIKVLSYKPELKVSEYTSNTVDRVQVLQEFEKGFFDTLVAIRCFDQGVDVPKLDKIYIMSSDELSRQTIQRRGRVLRKCKESGKDNAYIYDMVVLPPMFKGAERENNFAAKALFNKEFKRAFEYADLANNKAEVLYGLNNVLVSYGDFEMEDVNEFEF